MLRSDAPLYSHKVFKWVLDNLVACAVLVFSLFFRLGLNNFLEIDFKNLFLTLTLIPISLAFGSLFFRTYSTSWRFFSTQDIKGFLGFYTSFVSLFLISAILTENIKILPRNSLLLFLLMSFFAMGGLRVFYKLKREMTSKNLPSSEANLTRGGLIYVGTLDKLDGWIKSINLYEGNITYHILGAVAVEKAITGIYVRGVPVLGHIHNLEKITESVIKHKNMKGFLVENGMGTKNFSDLNEASKVASLFGLKLFKIPSPQEIHGKSDVQNIKPVEISDLLGRTQRDFNCNKVSKILNNKKIVVTGAGGSIGSELVKQLSDFNLSKLILIENSEYNLYRIETWLKNFRPDLLDKVKFCFSDIRDRHKIQKIFKKHTPDVVYHAAALKHVPLMEDNQIECIKTNVLGSKNLVDVSLENKVEQFIFISTDKAVNPENTMGFTKRSAELYCQAADAKSSTIFRIVRFGNVLGSSGSVIPLFKSQIEDGGPLTVTDPETTRFFMTIPEAVNLVLQTSLINKKESTDVFVLEMGEPVNILTLAEKMIRLSGFEPYTDIKIKFIGLRPGEKLHEELYVQASSMKPTNISGILVTDGRSLTNSSIIEHINSLLLEIEDKTANEILYHLSHLIPENKMKLTNAKLNYLKGFNDNVKNNLNIQ